MPPDSAKDGSCPKPSSGSGADGAWIADPLDEDLRGERPELNQRLLVQRPHGEEDDGAREAAEG